MKNRVNLLTMEYYPDKGGVANYYHGLVKALKNHGIETKIVKFDSNIRWWQVFIKIFFTKADYNWVGNILPIGTAAWLTKLLLKRNYFVSLHGFDIKLALDNKPWLTKKY